MSVISRPSLPAPAALGSAMIDLQLAPAVAARLTPTQVSFISANLQAACDSLSVSGEVRARIVADPEMADAHKQFSRIDGPTDVLTFDLSEGASAQNRHLDCDLLLCLDEATRQADPRAHPVERELLLYAVHGVLHCLGEDDHTDAGYAKMHAAEDQLLERIGVGSTFATPAPSTAQAPAQAAPFPAVAAPAVAVPAVAALAVAVPAVEVPAVAAPAVAVDASGSRS